MCVFVGIVKGVGLNGRNSTIALNLYNFSIKNSFPFHQTLALGATLLGSGHWAHTSVSELHRLGFCNISRISYVNSWCLMRSKSFQELFLTSILW